MMLHRTLGRARNLSKSLYRLRKSHTRTVTNATEGKKEGDISDAFASLSGQEFKPLEPRFADLKRRLVQGNEDKVQASWDRLLLTLRKEIPIIASLGPRIIPEIDFSEIDNPSAEFVAEHKKRGVAVVRNVLPEKEAVQLKTDLQSYIRANPHTKAFPPSNPQVYELYWSPSQMKARTHPKLLKTQKFLMSHWHSENPSAAISLSHPTAYADQLRIRQPGDSRFAPGPHVEGGSCERWEEHGYGLGHVYDSIFQGQWEQYDPWEASCRLPVVSDLYGGIGACSMLQLYQGWLAMSSAGPFEGTLLVNPLLGVATAYYLLRPFFSPVQSNLSSSQDFLQPSNWRMLADPDSWLQGASPGRGQELRGHLHPHLGLEKTMVHVPQVRPGDYVAWHCDTIHAIDQVHKGTSDSSVMYIPSCPLSEVNAQYLARQRDAFLNGTPGPDFPGGEGESRHVGKPTVDDMLKTTEAGSLRAFGLESWNSEEELLSPGQKTIMDFANKSLGFYD
ncbi:MAG: hypothetical protein M1831_007044 [Alyxoria varia]|nr:MAG: hypothetical protein M1831_007044 [Alyxoria varia]